MPDEERRHQELLGAPRPRLEATGARLQDPSPAGATHWLAPVTERRAPLFKLEDEQTPEVCSRAYAILRFR